MRVKKQTGINPNEAEAAAIGTIERYALESPSTTDLEIWRDELDNAIGISITDDGMRAIAFFGSDGKMLGDWMV